jgi:ribose 5-phosphate isomerase A
MDLLKQAAGRYAADLVRSGTVVGLGTGSTARHAIERLGVRVRGEGLAIRGIPTSQASADLARHAGVPLITFDDCEQVDLTIDGADEVDPDFNLIKGGGGALLHEKVVASRSAEVVIVIDPSKLVSRLGAAMQRLPIEVVPFAATPVAAEMRALGGDPLRREGDGGRPFVTDSGNWILDVGFRGGIAHPARLEAAIDAVPGVVESGLFIALCDRLVIGRAGTPELRESGRRRRG